MNCATPNLGLSRLHWPVTTLGYGRRVGIWFQGCSIRCVGCCSQDTWEEATTTTRIEEILGWIAERPIESINGFTLSGGEPFDQPVALHYLLKVLRRNYCVDQERDILVYSGYPWSTLQRNQGALLSQCDVLISGSYVANRAGGWLRGSDNQLIHLLSALGRARYGHAVDETTPCLQYHFDGTSLWFIGIPRPGDLERLRERLYKVGINLGNVSWV